MIFRPSDGYFGYSNNNTVLGTLMAGASALVKRKNKRKSREMAFCYQNQSDLL